MGKYSDEFNQEKGDERPGRNLPAATRKEQNILGGARPGLPPSCIRRVSAHSCVFTIFSNFDDLPLTCKCKLGSDHEENTRRCVLDSLAVSVGLVSFPTVRAPALSCLFPFLTPFDPRGLA